MSITIDFQTVESIEIDVPTTFAETGHTWFTQKVRIKTDRGDDITLNLFIADKSLLLDPLCKELPDAPNQA